MPRRANAGQARTDDQYIQHAIPLKKTQSHMKKISQ
jgi:hypothetical protein